MNRFCGKDVEIVFKDKGKIKGLLLELDDETVFLQITNQSVAGIPMSNVLYYIVEKYCPKSDKIINSDSNFLPKQVAVSSHKKNEIVVYVNETKVTTLLAPPNMDISYFNQILYDMVWNNEQVQDAIKTKEIESIDYDCGVVTILIKKGETILSDKQESKSEHVERFVTTYMNPSDIINMVNASCANKKGGGNG